MLQVICPSYLKVEPVVFVYVLGGSILGSRCEVRPELIERCGLQGCSLVAALQRGKSSGSATLENISVSE